MKQWYKNRKKDHFDLKAKKNDLISRAYYKIEEIDKRFHLITKKIQKSLISDAVLEVGRNMFLIKVTHTMSWG